MMEKEGFEDWRYALGEGGARGLLNAILGDAAAASEGERHVWIRRVTFFGDLYLTAVQKREFAVLVSQTQDVSSEGVEVAREENKTLRAALAQRREANPEREKEERTKASLRAQENALRIEIAQLKAEFSDLNATALSSGAME
ncbi:hypothetical protein [Rhodospirillum sp. A1_3_36]|uniref:hypothetical protein n=1 Tax=Rhodospirillum sp. A1_3_36 TaxID=3391666 RepID=UPI0039A44C64